MCLIMLLTIKKMKRRVMINSHSPAGHGSDHSVRQQPVQTDEQTLAKSQTRLFCCLLINLPCSSLFLFLREFNLLAIFYSCMVCEVTEWFEVMVTWLDFSFLREKGVN